MGDRTECQTRGNLDVVANQNTYQQRLKRRPENQKRKGQKQEEEKIVRKPASKEMTRRG